ncbi:MULTISPECIES: DUF1642 domain-containing protein [unclassified Enterococcus]|uniref:DUF1642 domain-containing protein n=1 Tax=unclassified Enterococcus TaxID=2608891 RepID=UPI00155661C9|nr:MULTISPECIES: DUF1642 domain-containing protein [unclassified Enterococcus]MBS7578315.1 DUF1642 domain-containing protein [Enterococcus sp. MMGLQ5-2]MBS7585474.1 DUF1642 domain-containing protein [Enterococcus sp. MMGLQ5-1]NPD13331.1 DUF1642 domain-containing protein [Enterococcus sp. MMGLQ5-1]NPD38146.1 DUF1642 domain-containing protein [Enterococcus sp. MMGLQ5-2]
MSKLSKEELIEALKINVRNCSDSWDGGYNTAIKNAIDLAKQLPDTPNKVVVSLPEEIIRHLESFKREKPELLEALGEGWGDMAWFENAENQEKYAQAWLTGEYEVEQPKRWAVVKNEEYFIKFKSHVTDGIPYHSLTGANKDYAYEFTDKRKAELVAELIGGAVEEVSNE